MSKVTEFLNKVLADEAAKAEFDAVIGVRKERELNDDDFQKIVELSEKLGASVTLDEVKDFFSGNGRELSEEELAGVAGGRSSLKRLEGIKFEYICPVCGKDVFESSSLSVRQTLLDYQSNVEARKLIDEHLNKHMSN